MALWVSRNAWLRRPGLRVSRLPCGVRVCARAAFPPALPRTEVVGLGDGGLCSAWPSGRPSRRAVAPAEGNDFPLEQCAYGQITGDAMTHSVLCRSTVVFDSHSDLDQSVSDC